MLGFVNSDIGWVNECQLSSWIACDSGDFMNISGISHLDDRDAAIVAIVIDTITYRSTPRRSELLLILSSEKGICKRPQLHITIKIGIP
jgi:hypothetical protein